MILYLAVTPDILELPLVVTDSLKEMQNLTGVKSTNISSMIYQKKSGKTLGYRFYKVEVEEDNEEID